MKNKKTEREKTLKEICLMENRVFASSKSHAIRSRAGSYYTVSLEVHQRRATGQVAVSANRNITRTREKKSKAGK